MVKLAKYSGSILDRSHAFKETYGSVGLVRCNINLKWPSYQSILPLTFSCSSNETHDVANVVKYLIDMMCVA